MAGGGGGKWNDAGNRRPLFSAWSRVRPSIRISRRTGPSRGKISDYGRGESQWRRRKSALPYKINKWAHTRARVRGLAAIAWSQVGLSASAFYLSVPFITLFRASGGRIKRRHPGNGLGGWWGTPSYSASDRQINLPKRFSARIFSDRERITRRDLLAWISPGPNERRDPGSRSPCLTVSSSSRTCRVELPDAARRRKRA